MQKGKNDKYILREVQLLDKICHPNIISIMAFSCSIIQIHIVTEYFKSDSLFHIIFYPNVKKNYLITLNNKMEVLNQVACALTFLHLQQKQILHRDVKPGNILCNNRFEVKLCDLGLGKSKLSNNSLQSRRYDTVRGMYLFMAPEIILHQRPATASTDV